MGFFEPLPPPPEPRERRWSPPIWDRPSEGTLPATLPVDALLSQHDDAAVAISHLDVFPNGFRINVVVLVNPHRPPDLRLDMHRGARAIPRIGVRFSDGRVGGREGVRGLRTDVPKDNQGVPIEPYVGFGGGGGGTGGWRFGAWVFPLPSEGPLEIFVAFPSHSDDETRFVLEGSAVRTAAEGATVIWS